MDSPEVIAGQIIVENSRFTVAAPGALPGCAYMPGNGLVGVPPHLLPHEAGTVAVVATGVSDQEVDVVAQAWAGRPPPLDLRDWEDAAEVTISWPGGRLRLLGEDTVPLAELAFTRPLAPGPHRLLVAGRDRDHGEARAAGIPVDAYLIRLHPVAGEDPGELILKATSQTGAMWREGFG